MTLFSGLAAFPVTPIDAEGLVDGDRFGRLIGRLADAGVESIGVLGSTGAYPYLAAGERRRAIAAAREAAGGRAALLVGVGAMRTDEVVAHARAAEAEGADGLLLAPVSYIPLLEDEVFALFEDVAGATDLPVCVYNNPGTTHFTIGADLLGRLATIPKVVAAKNPAPAADEVAAYHAERRAKVPGVFALGYSADWNVAEALIAGGAAWYSVAAGLFPEPCLAIANAVAEGRIEEARALNGRLEPLWALFRRYTSFRVVHAAARALGVIDTLPPRPILPLDDAAIREVSATLERLDLR